MTHRWRLSALVFGVGLTLLATSSLTSVLQARATVTTVASGLANPRGLNFGPDGALYVAEAGSGGSGPCILGSDGLVKCYGTTGAVTKIVLGGPAEPCRHRASVNRGITRHHGSGHRNGTARRRLSRAR